MLPRVPKPMLALPGSALPIGHKWSYEVKWDGYRTLASKHGARVTLYSRNMKDVSKQYSPIARAVSSLPHASLILDGEIVAVDERGHPSFQALHHSVPATLAYYVFDLLHLDGRDLTAEPLSVRREMLAAVTLQSPVIRSEPLPGTPAQIEEAVRGLELEGIVAKRVDSKYEPGRRSGAWTKVKFQQRQEFVVGGFRADGAAVDALVVGYFADRRLRSAAKVRAGLTPRSRRDLYAKLRPLQTEKCPFANLPETGSSHWGEGITAEEMRELTWVKPQMVVEIAFTEWTRDSHLRHASFVDVRTDKDAREVRRERS